MNKFHTTVSRRNFMKGLGLGMAGLGAAGATTPVFHDVDEIMSAPNATRNWPWYMKERDYFDLTVEVDWDGKERYDSRNSYSFTAEERAQWIETRKDLVIKGIQNNEPGNSLKDHALLAGSAIYTYPPFEGNPEVEFGGVYATREELGVSPWQGTPEEALRMVKTASEFYECRELGVTEITDKSTKCIDANDSQGRPYVFVDTDKPANNREIPKKCKWVISWLVPQPAALAWVMPSSPSTGRVCPPSLRTWVTRR